MATATRACPGRTRPGGRDLQRLTPKLRSKVDGRSQRSLLSAIQQGKVSGPAWQGLPPSLFFAKRLLHDIAAAYYAHPASWNEIGFGGPAGPRGYVRMNFDRRDPWEAAEAAPGREEKVRQSNEHVG
jgi:hypothetical protein